MNNAQHNTLDVKTVCENKLDIEFRAGGKEYNGWFEHNGKKITRITVPKGRKPIPRRTYQKMAEQLRLTIPEFDDFLACPFKFKDYMESLRKQKII